MSKKKRGDDISHLACHQEQRSVKTWTSTPRQEERHFMNQTMFGTTHPDAPPELAQFAFLIGTWKCKGKVKSPEDEWQEFAADWIGQYILEGKAIADEFRATWPDGSLFMHGQNIRIYSAEQKMWRMKWIDALAGTVIKMGGPELGGVKVANGSITFHVPHTEGQLLRSHYLNITDECFSWRGSILNDDDETWEEMMTIEATRAEG